MCFVLTVLIKYIRRINLGVLQVFNTIACGNEMRFVKDDGKSTVNYGWLKTVV